MFANRHSKPRATTSLELIIRLTDRICDTANKLVCLFPCAAGIDRSFASDDRNPLFLCLSRCNRIFYEIKDFLFSRNMQSIPRDEGSMLLVMRDKIFIFHVAEIVHHSHPTPLFMHLHSCISILFYKQ